MPAARKTQPIVVKRYAQSRLYDATNQRYVSIKQLRKWVTTSIAFSVIDVETGADIKRVLLA